MLLHVLVYCAIATLYLLLTFITLPRIWLHRMPISIRDSVARQSQKEKISLALVGLPWLVFVVGYPVYFAVMQEMQAWQAAKSTVTFWLVFIVIDTLLIDLLLLCKLRPRLIRIRGTLAADYDDVSHHLKAGLQGSIMALGASVFVYLLW